MLIRVVIVPALPLLLLTIIALVWQCYAQNSTANGTTTTSSSSTQSTGVGVTAPIIQLKVGLLFANGSARLQTLFGFGQSAPAITLALQRASTEHLMDNVNISFSWKICDCDQPRAVGYTNEFILNEKIDVIIGPPCVLASLVSGLDAGFYNTPIFVWGASVATDFSNTTLYPTLTNVNTNTQLLSMGVNAVLMQFGWTEVAFVYVPDQERMMCQYFQRDFAMIANANPNLTITYTQQMDSSSASMHYALGALSNRSRIVVSCFDNEYDRRNFLLAIYDAGLAKSDEYVFIFGALRSQGMLQQVNLDLSKAVTSGDNNSITYEGMWVDKAGTNADGRDADALAAVKRSMVVDLENQSTTDIDAFIAQMYAQFGQAPFYCDADCMGGKAQANPSQYASTLYDVTYTFARAVNKTMQLYGPQSKAQIQNGTLLSMLSQGVFQGETGTVVIDDSGLRQPTFFVTMLDGSATPKPVINVTISNMTVFTQNMYTSPAALWINYGGKQPQTTPRCGYSGKDCPQDVTVYVICGAALVLLLAIATGGGIGYAMREKMKERERLTRECVIPFSELRNLKELRSNENLSNKSENEKSMRSMHSSVSGGTKAISLNSDTKKLETEDYALFAYNREVVVGTKYAVRVRIDSADLVHLRKLRQMDHDNLNKFMGVCLDAPILYAVWKHCQRGSLKQVIAKEQYVGDTFVMLSLMRDIANGLIAIHQSFVGHHGMLSSENCLINDRWQVKISDFGLNMIRESQPAKKKRLLWSAPELLRENDRKGSKEGDVYSFGIICVEMMNRETVWNGVEREDDVEEIIYRVKRGARTAIPHRPQLHTREEMPNQQSMFHLIRDCWAEEPSERPKMDLVRTMLRQMNTDGNRNLMDYVFGMLEQYASSLEQEVEERTKELVEEKRKSDILLYRMLPRQVAEKLKLGEAVEPESFQMATVFFSDVVQFTTLASKCSPLQVVNLLNNLYTTFDNIIDSHDAYKVETIGDGYLICSGIPKRNGDMHVKEIAELAFAFMRTVTNFRIDHLPSERVNLRIGFHTGPAVAGVVGLTMPRYCLFGDTVNTASRMESSGKPGQIHISSVANHYLTNLIGGYATEPRGEVIIKGKGVMETYWLLGHNSAEASTPMYNAYVANMDV